MALKTNSMKKKETKVEVKAEPTIKKGDKPFKFVRDDQGRLSIKITIDE